MNFAIMKKIRMVFGVLVVLVLSLKCTSPTVELTGMVQNGLNGDVLAGVKVMLEGTTLSTVTDDKGSFSLEIPLSSNPEVLITRTNGYQQEKYQISSRTSDLVINMMPEPKEFKASDYTGPFISFTSPLEQEVQWENIIDGIRSFYEKRIDVMKPSRERYGNRDDIEFIGIGCVVPLDPRVECIGHGPGVVFQPPDLLAVEDDPTPFAVAPRSKEIERWSRKFGEGSVGFADDEVLPPGDHQASLVEGTECVDVEADVLGRPLFTMAHDQRVPTLGE